MRRFETLPDHVTKIAQIIHDRVDRMRAECIGGIELELDLLDSDARLLEDLAFGALKDLRQDAIRKPE